MNLATILASAIFLGALPFSQGQAHPDEPQKFDPKVIKAPVAINSPIAEMPDAARRAKTSGACLVSLVVDVQGDPQNVHALRCTDPMFEKNSIDAANKYRFKPARRISDDSVVPVILTIDITYRLHGLKFQNPVAPTRYQLSAPPGALSAQPDAEGIYSLTPQMDAPEIVHLKADRFAEVAYALQSKVECQVLLVLDANGKPGSAKVDRCEPSQSYLSGPAVQSVMNSKYKPAKLNGRKVPVRLIVHLIYEGGTMNGADAP